MNIKLPDVQTGDPLLLTPRDNEGVVGATITLIFDPDCENGIAEPQKRDVLPGVIDVAS